MKIKKQVMFIVIVFMGLILFKSYATKENTELIENKAELNLGDYTWLIGHWKGDGFGGISEEIWAPPIDGTMMGMYRHYKEGKLVFYEFLLLNKDGLKLKHFHPDLIGWEAKDDFTTFAMVEYSAHKLVLKGLTFEKKSDTKMEIRLKLKRNGKIETEVFKMYRVE